jgi:anaerobic selenocysteine-containing dehydrogenase
MLEPHLPAEEMPDQQFPYILNTGRLEHQWHTLAKTGRVARLNRLNPGPFVEIHPEDARTLGIRDGQLMRVASRRGMAVLPAAVTDRVQAETASCLSTGTTTTARTSPSMPSPATPSTRSHFSPASKHAQSPYGLHKTHDPRAHGKEASAETNTSIEMRNLAVIYLQLKQ